MRNKILSFIFMLAIAVPSQAQTPDKLLTIKGGKFDLGFAWDKYQDMDMEWMKQRTDQSGAFNEDLSGMEGGQVIYSSFGANVGGQVLFTAPRLGNDLLISEVRFGVAMILGKEAIVDFYDNNPTTQTNRDYNSLMYCFVENETRLSSEIVWRVLDESKITFYAGLGANLSASLANELYVFSDFMNNRSVTGNNFQPMDFNSVQDTYDGKSVFYQRLYVPVGIDIKMFRHLQGTVEYKIGGGMEKVIGGQTNTFRTGEFNFGLRVNIEMNNTPSILDLF